MSNKRAHKIFAFREVTVSVLPNNYKVIEWVMDQCFRIDEPILAFYVEYARAAGEWCRLNADAPVIDQCMYVDSDSYRCNLNNDVFYRVVAYDGVREYTSKPACSLGVLNRHDWRIARDVVRKEYLRLKRYVGAEGYLLKQRTYGPQCQECLEFDTLESGNSLCSNCFGTGVVGGYYTGLPFWVDISGYVKESDVELGRGVVDNRNITGRCVAYPRVDPYDVWVQAHTNKRYNVRKVQIAVNVRTKPLVYVLEMREIPASAREYGIPLVPDIAAASSSAAEAKATDGWRQGISCQEIL